VRIGVIIGRIGDVDGVALETEKWIKVLTKMGHEVFILSGRFKKNIVGKDREAKWSGLSFFSPECEWEQNRAFFFPPDDPHELLEHLHHTSKKIAVRIFKWVLENKLEVILSENSTALPCHLSMGIGIRKAIEVTGIPCVAHDHDFHWERGDRYKSPFKKITEIVEDNFPANLPNIKHAVINLQAKKDLKARLGVNAEVVPNVMDFNKPYGRVNDYNRDLKQEIGLEKGDIPLFQVTRIVRRKGIEVAIDLVHRLGDKRFKLIITGSAADDERKGYYKELVDKIKEHKLGKQVIFGDKRILNDRGTYGNGRKIYSLSDAYAHAAASTYFSYYEGFGNAFVECILSKTPIFVNNYKPVYWPDIGSKGFKTVMLEDNVLTDKAVDEAREILLNKKLQKEIAEHNFELGKKLFSYEVLEEKLEKLFKF
jgi:glycosyltransferase involved in cell wall biosynthesis